MHDPPRIVVACVKVGRVAGQLDGERAGSRPRDGRIGVEQVPAGAGHAIRIGHVYAHAAAVVERDGAAFQRGHRAGGVARIHLAGNRQVADGSVAHQHARAIHRVR